MLIAKFWSHLGTASHISFLQAFLLFVQELLCLTWDLPEVRIGVNEAFIDAIETTEDAFILCSELSLLISTSCWAIYATLFFHLLSMHFDRRLNVVIFRNKVLVLHGSITLSNYLHSLALVHCWRESILRCTRMPMHNLGWHVSERSLHLSVWLLWRHQGLRILLKYHAHFGAEAKPSPVHQLVIALLEHAGHLSFDCMRRLRATRSDHFDCLHVWLVHEMTFVFEFLLPTHPTWRHSIMFLTDVGFAQCV